MTTSPTTLSFHSFLLLVVFRFFVFVFLLHSSSSSFSLSFHVHSPCCHHYHGVLLIIILLFSPNFIFSAHFPCRPLPSSLSQTLECMKHGEGQSSQYSSSGSTNCP